MAFYGVHPEWHIRVCPETGRDIFPKADWIFTKQEANTLKQQIIDMVWPDGYGEDLKKIMTTKKAMDDPKGYKTHSAHNMLHHMIPIAIEGLGSPKVQHALKELGKLFQ